MLTIWTLQAIKHEKLDRPGNPCNQSLSYSFADCVHRSVMARAGCQPPWRLVSLPGLPLCDNLALLGNYSEEYVNIAYIGRNDLLERTKCLLPCTYIEYRVGQHLHKIANTHIIIFPRWQKRTLSDSRLEKLSSFPCSPATRF